MSAVEPGTASADPGAAAVPPGAVAEASRVAAEAPVSEGSPAEILKNLGIGEEEETEQDLGAEGGIPPAEDKAEAKKPEPTPEDEEATRLKEINARSLQRRRAKEAARRPALTATPAPAPAATAVADAAAAAAKAAETAAAKPANGTSSSPESIQAMKDVLAAIDKLAGEDEAATTAAAASGKPDAGADARAKELAVLRTTVEKIADGLKETDALKTKLEDLGQKLQDQEDEKFVRQHIDGQLAAIASAVPELAARRDAVDLIHAASVKFFQKYKVAPDTKEIAKRIEKKLQGTGPETKNGEKTTATRKTVSTTSHSSPPAQRQGPDKRSSKEAEADFYKRVGMPDEVTD